MPKQYTAIRDSLFAQGVPKKKAKKKAAMIYNAKRKKGAKPVTGSHA